jgi:ketosteroid isomerase-like protein
VHVGRDTDAVAEALRSINQSWLEGRPLDMKPLLHPEIVLVVPGFTGRVGGRDAFIAGFVDFCQSARIVSFQEDEYQVDQVGETAVASFQFDMVYERDGSRCQATGRDLWVFTREADGWVACWRTMLDLNEEPV